MNKTLLTLTLSAFALGAAAEQVLVPVTHREQIVDGGKYIVVTRCVGLNSGNFWANEKVLTDAGSTSSWATFTGDKPEIADNVIWTAETQTENACTGTAAQHTNGVIISLKNSQGKYWMPSASEVTTTDNSASGNVHGAVVTWVPATAAFSVSSPMPAAFNIHFRLANYNRFLGINQNGAYGAFSHSGANANVTDNGCYIASGKQWGFFFGLYKVEEKPEGIITFVFNRNNGTIGSTSSASWAGSLTFAAADGVPAVTITTKNAGGSVAGLIDTRSTMAATIGTNLGFGVGGSVPSSINITVPDGYYVWGYDFTAKRYDLLDGSINIIPQGSLGTRTMAANFADSVPVMVRGLEPTSNAHINFSGSNKCALIKDFKIYIARIDANIQHRAEALVSTGLFTDHEAAEMAENQTRALSELLTRMNDQKFFIYNAGALAYRMFIDGTKLHTTNATLSPYHVWQAKTDPTNGTIKLHNLATGLWAKDYGTNSTTDDEAQATAYRFNFSTANASYFSMQVGEGSNQFLNKQSDCVNNYSCDTGSSWRYTPVTSTNESTFRNALWLYTLGNTPGTYSKPTATEEEINAYKEAVATQQATTGFCYETFKTISDFEASGLEFFDMNALVAPVMITMTYEASGWNDRQVQESNYNVGDVNYLSIGATAAKYVLSEGKFHSYNEGRALFSNASGVEIHAGDDLATNEATVYSFGRVNPDTPSATASHTGLHWNFIKESESNKYWGGTSTTSKRINFGNLSSTPGKNYGYIISYVENLDVDVDGQKFFRLPVAATVAAGEDVAAYVISLSTSGDEEVITTTQADESTVYAAGTGLILYGTGTITFNLHNNEQGNATYASSILGGHALKAYTPADGKIGLVIGTVQQPEQNQVRRRTSGEQAVEMTYIDSHSALPAHAAVLEVNRTDKTIAGQNLSVPLGNAVTTGIKGVTTLSERPEEAIYDLQGRRLAAPAKGLNIINGQKTLVK